jgi:F plasmid transfer operon protein TraF
MTTFVVFSRAGLTAALIAVSAPASAQIYEIVGTRAQGMGGAFVAVADDATATWWNPAGIATGPYANIMYDRVRTVDPADPALEAPSWLGQTSAYAFAYPALGLSVYRLRVSEIRPLSSNETAEAGRQDPGASGVNGVDLRSVALTEYGASVVQSLGAHLFVGSTLKIVRGGSVISTDAESGSALDRLKRASEMDVSSETHTDLDIGVLATSTRARVGVTVKHVRQPEFGEGDLAIRLKRQVRAGLAIVGATSGALSSITAAVDADLTRTMTALGEVRHIAAGAEALLFKRRVGLRGGVSANTVGQVGNSMSVGLSLGSSSAYIDGALTFGSDKTRDGWGLSLRLSL